MFLFAKHAAEGKIGVREQLWLCKSTLIPWRLLDSSLRRRGNEL